MKVAAGAVGSVRRAESALSPADSWSRFLLRKPAYAPQYAQLYFCRLVALRPGAREAARRAWGVPSETLRYADSVLAAAATPDVDAAVAGVVFRDLPGKPSILAQYGRSSSVLIPAPPARGVEPYSSDSSRDRVVLEDETGRFALDVSDVSDRFSRLATGFVVAVRGREDRKTGAFKVSAFVSTGLAPQPPLRELPADRFICIVSGLGFGDQRTSPLAGELLLEYLRANVGGEEEETFCGAIAHLIVAGNCVSMPTEDVCDGGRSSRTLAALLKPQLPVRAGTQLDASSAIVYADRFLTAAAASLPTSVMPGEDDPVNYLLPQQPIHRCLLPSASRQANLDRVTNPYERHFDGRVFLGTAGQNIADFHMYNSHPVSAGADGAGAAEGGTLATLAAMRDMLDNRHLAPTAPDTLGSYPFCESDPFVIDRSPHVFFTGNQAAFGTSTHRPSASRASLPGDACDARVRLVSVPRFDVTGTAVLVNLRTLDCTSISFRGNVQ
jgi:DNA polymerase delta subunit 2